MKVAVYVNLGALHHSQRSVIANHGILFSVPLAQVAVKRIMRVKGSSIEKLLA